MKLEELKKEIETLIEFYFEEKVQGFEKDINYDTRVKDVISTCNIEVEFLDNELEKEIEVEEDQREYEEACDKLGVPYRNDI